MTLKNFGTWLEINLSTLRNNFKVLSEFSAVKVMPIVKANAYGHGLERVAAELENEGAEWFGVARIEEALKLRELGIQSKILVLGFTPMIRVPHAIKEKISLTVYDYAIAEEYAHHAWNLHQQLDIHIKIETGMGRLGVPADKSLEIIKFVSDNDSLNLEGIFTHFACADEPERDVTSKQINLFDSIIKELESKKMVPKIIHAANSSGMINFPETRFNLVRAGIALYGHPPSNQTKLPDGISPALEWKTRLISIKELPAGHGVSYGHRYHTKRKELVGVIAAGYGDGLRRINGNHVLIRGKQVPIIGSVCMDQCMVSLNEIPDVEIGDEVCIIGRQLGVEISATDIANNWDTINYEVLCGLAARMHRYYLNS